MNSTIKAHLYLFLAQVIYALNYSIAKDLMPTYLTPFALVLFRVSGACILFWTLSLFLPKEKIDGADLKKIMILAIFGVAVNQLFFLCGLSLTTPINSAIIMVSNPIAVMLFTLVVLKEKLTSLKLSGLALGVIGAVILLLFKAKGAISFGSETMAGDLMTLVNSLSWAVFVVMAKPLMQKYQTVTVMKWLFLVGLIYVIPFSANDMLQTNFSGFLNPIYYHLPFMSFTGNVLFSVLFVVIATTFFAYLLNTYALKTLSSSVVSMYIYFQPFLATIIAVLLGKDEITPIKLISAVFIVMGVYLVSKKNNDKKLQNT